MRKEIIIQIIANNIVERQLHSPEESATKNVFHRIKHNWINIVQPVQEPCQFTVNKSKLKNELQTAGLSSYMIPANNTTKKEHRRKSENTKTELSMVSLSEFERSASLPNKSLEVHLNNAEAEESLKHRGKNDINLSLLENAIIAHAFRYHNLDINKADVDIIILKKVFNNSFYR